MLREFRVKDFALADDIQVSLGDGLSLLMGRKPESNMVRAGCERAVEAS
jgi:DNA repair ATPase RecN